MKKLLVFLTFFLLLSFIQPTDIYANLLPLNPFNSSCSQEFEPVYCKVTMKDYSSPVLKNECTMYENNSDFREVSYKKDFSNGLITITYQYCPINSSAKNNLMFKTLTAAIPALVLTIILEGLVLLLFKFFTNFRIVFSFILVNIFSYSGLLLFLNNTIAPFNYYIWMIILEILVVVFEVNLLKIMTRKTYSQIILPVFMANLVSATLGTFLFNFFIKPLLW